MDYRRVKLWFRFKYCNGYFEYMGFFFGLILDVGFICIVLFNMGIDYFLYLWNGCISYFFL